MKLSKAVLSLLVVPALTLASSNPPPPASTDTSPILVELFTSEGCSSCPPADALLQQLDRQPISGAQVIVLSEHVDYWNHDGWQDPYSSSLFSDRQTLYVRRFGLPGGYTPQMVVDGASQFTGSDAALAGRTIDAARSHPKVAIHSSAFSVENTGALHLHLQVDPLPESSKGRKANVYIVVALDHAQSSVLAGENKGRNIAHVAVVQSINKVGVVEKGKAFDQDVSLKRKASADPSNLRVIAFVQESDAGPVLGASLVQTAK